MHTFAQGQEASRQDAPDKVAVEVRAHSGQRRGAGPRTAATGTLCSYDFARIPVRAGTPRAIQTKLTVGDAGDEYEREADRVAEQVLRAPAGRLQRDCACAGKCSGCRTGRTGREPETRRTITPLIQTKSDRAASVGDSLASSIQGSRGGGASLDDATRAEMEGRFGADFRAVKVHTDGEAARMNEQLGARAFTLGSDIYFNHNYEPRSSEGRRLLAHELTHVLQQGGGRERERIQRWAVSGCTVSQEEEINSAVIRAYDDLTRVLPRVSARPVTDAVKDALWLAFRDDSDATADLARDNLRTLSTQVNGTRFACADTASDPDCRGSRLAYAPLGRTTGTVGLCRPQFFADDMSLISQSETVIHEAAHMYLSMEDHGYFTSRGSLCAETAQPADVKDPGTPESGTAGDNPAHRLENADSYGCLLHYLRYLPAQQRQDTAAAYRGANLSIASENLTFALFTRTLTPRRHPFSISGAPDNSGFRYRWRIRANSREYSPTSMNEAADAAAFSPDNRAIYVPASLVQMLWRDGVRRVTLVCEIELFRAHGDRFAPRVVTKEAELTVEDGEPPLNL